MATESRYKALQTRVDDRKNNGYNYDGKILLRTTDPNLYKNDRMRGFALKLEPIIQSWFRMVKQIKTFVNYHVPQDTNNIN